MEQHQWSAAEEVVFADLRAEIDALGVLDCGPKYRFHSAVWGEREINSSAVGAEYV